MSSKKWCNKLDWIDSKEEFVKLKLHKLLNIIIIKYAKVS